MQTHFKEGTKVTLGKGRTVYKVYLYSNYSNMYTLVAEISGRKRYNVPRYKLRPVNSSFVVRTSKGPVQRPAAYTSLPRFTGGTRSAYLTQEWVFKEPLGAYGADRNRIEACLYAIQSGKVGTDQAALEFGVNAAREAKYYLDVPMAECYLLEDGTLMMERVRPVYNILKRFGGEQLTAEELRDLGFDEPKWAYRVDSGQIGYTTKNKLVAYDL